MTNHLKNNLQEFAAGRSILEPMSESGFLIGQPQIHGGNFRLIGDVIKLIPCKDSTLLLGCAAVRIKPNLKIELLAPRQLGTN